MSQIPKRFQQLSKKYPGVVRAYEALGDKVHEAGPLDRRTRALVKLGISAGARLEGAVHSHTRKAIAVGASAEELRHVALLSLPTVGLPTMMAALSWIDDVIEETKPKRTKK